MNPPISLFGGIKGLPNNTGQQGLVTLGRVVASDSRGPQFESSHRQTFKSNIYLFTVNYIAKDENKEKSGRE